MSESDHSQWDRMLAGEWYLADEPGMPEKRERARRLVGEYAAAYDADPRQARATLESLLGRVGERVDIRPPLYVDYGELITIGDGTFINFGLVALDVAAISIGRYVQIGPNVQLLAPVHPLEAGPRREGLEAGRPITIGDNVWLGGGVIVLPGVTIGENAVVGAGAVVTKEVPRSVLVAGNPARVIRDLG